MYGAGAPAGTFYADPASDQLAPVLATFAGPVPQRRWTVLIRFIMAIPHLICLWALGVAAGVIALIGWFAALFTGELPDFAATFLGGYLHWQVRVGAYLALLTDQYPPFELGDAPYPVRVAFRPGRLNRLAVLFRIFLMIPAGIVVYLLQIGAYTILAFVTWLIVLITGSMPASLYQAYAAAIRYSARYQGFALMLTSTYPGGLFGDQAVASPEPGFAQPEPAFGTVEPGPGAAEDGSASEPAFGAAEPAFGATEPGSGAAEAPDEPGFAQPVYAQPTFAQPAAGYAGPAAAYAAPDPWRLVLSSPARKLVGVFIGAGVLGLAGIIAGEVAVANGVSSVIQVNSTYHTLDVQLNSELASANACGNNVSCVTGVLRSVSATYSGFADQLDGSGVPSSSAGHARDLVVTDARKLASDYRQLSGATSATQFNAMATSIGVNGDVSKFRADSDTLAVALGTTITG